MQSLKLKSLEIVDAVLEVEVLTIPGELVDAVLEVEVLTLGEFIVDAVEVEVLTELLIG